MGSIGVFDSGIGGLTVLKSLIKDLPQYNYMYLGDNARAPYGTRSFESVYEFTRQAVRFLWDQGCPLIIVACNTASAKALRTIQQVDLPTYSNSHRVLGVIRPTVEEVIKLSNSRHVGLLATTGTVNSQSYAIEFHKLDSQIKVHAEACPLWVPLIENNEYSTEGGLFFVKRHIEQLLNKSSKIDTIVLGCTHYPVLEEIIKEYVPSGISLISQGHIVSNSLKTYLFRHPEVEHRLSKNQERKYFTTDDPDTFNKKSTLFFDEQIRSNRIHL